MNFNTFTSAAKYFTVTHFRYTISTPANKKPVLDYPLFYSILNESQSHVHLYLDLIQQLLRHQQKAVCSCSSLLTCFLSLDVLH